MKRFIYQHGHKTKKIVGIALGVIGFLIIINLLSTKFLLFMIGTVLLLMGALLVMK